MQKNTLMEENIFFFLCVVSLRMLINTCSLKQPAWEFAFIFPRA